MKTLAFLLSLYKKRGKTQADERMFLEKFLQLFRKKPPKAIKVGLALGSGGAKGFAHIGAVKAFEERSAASWAHFTRTAIPPPICCS